MHRYGKEKGFSPRLHCWDRLFEAADPEISFRRTP
jgi:hypothetical protein